MMTDPSFDNINIHPTIILMMIHNKQDQNIYYIIPILFVITNELDMAWFLVAVAVLWKFQDSNIYLI